MGHRYKHGATWYKYAVLHVRGTRHSTCTQAVLYRYICLHTITSYNYLVQVRVRTGYRISHTQYSYHVQVHSTLYIVHMYYVHVYIGTSYMYEVPQTARHICHL